MPEKKILIGIVGVVAAAAILSVVIAFLIGKGTPGGGTPSEVTIYGVDATPHYNYATSSFGLELTIYGDVRAALTADVEFPPPGYTYSETIYPFSGKTTVYVMAVMVGGPYWVTGGDYKLTIRKLVGTEVYYEETFTFEGSGFKVISYSPSTLTSWSPTMSFTVINDGDFPSNCSDLLTPMLIIETWHGGVWDNFAVGGHIIVDEGSLTPLEPGKTAQFHFDISIPETRRDELRGQTRDAWLSVGTLTLPQITLTFPSS